MPEPVFTVPLSALVGVARSPYKNDDAWLWECSIAECSAGDFPPSESEARSAAVAHLEQVHGIRAVDRCSACRIGHTGAPGCARYEPPRTRICASCGYSDHGGLGPNGEWRYWLTDRVCIKCEESRDV